MYMNLSTFANQVGLSDEELTDHLIDLKILNQNGEPKKKYVKQEVFDDEGHI